MVKKTTTTNINKIVIKIITTMKKKITLKNKNQNKKKITTCLRKKELLRAYHK